jgi:simple sugar transport system ATP-binding protein
VLKYILQARELGRGVIFITHNPHHAYPVGDRFVLLQRGSLLGSYQKAETSVEHLTEMMAGGAELKQLSHELEAIKDIPSVAEAARELAAEAHDAT